MPDELGGTQPRIINPVTVTNQMEIQQDYSPNYDIRLIDEKVAEGTRIRKNANASSGTANLVDIDLANQSIVDALNAKYPKAWNAMYIGASPYSYTAENAYKLKRAVEFYIYLNDMETTNIVLEDYGENLEAFNVSGTEQIRVPYNEFMMSERWSEYRIPLDIQYNKDLSYGVGSEIPINAGKPAYYYDRDGNIIEIHEVVIVQTQSITNVDGNPQTADYPYDVGYKYVDSLGNTIPFQLRYIDETGNVLPAYVPIYVPFMLQSARKVSDELYGSRLSATPYDRATGTGQGFSKEYLALRDYQVGKVQTSSPYDWGSEFHTGKYTI